MRQPWIYGYMSSIGRGSRPPRYGRHVGVVWAVAGGHVGSAYVAIWAWLVVVMVVDDDNLHVMNGYCGFNGWLGVIRRCWV